MFEYVQNLRESNQLHQESWWVELVAEGQRTAIQLGTHQNTQIKKKTTDAWKYWKKEKMTGNQTIQ